MRPSREAGALWRYLSELLDLNVSSPLCEGVIPYECTTTHRPTLMQS